MKGQDCYSSVKKRAKLLQPRKHPSYNFCSYGKDLEISKHPSYNYASNTNVLLLFVWVPQISERILKTNNRKN
jgi:hypothetical protein